LNLDLLSKKSYSQFSSGAYVSLRTALQKLVTIVIKTPRSTIGGAK